MNKAVIVTGVVAALISGGSALAQVNANSLERSQPLTADRAVAYAQAQGGSGLMSPGSSLRAPDRTEVRDAAAKKHRSDARGEKKKRDGRRD
ncbi:MAG: hypothetical protein BGN86_07150 [Caulobacterales bacterium 68-7]|nr:MAG: hypothetical protein BGN86_07150 [Caulobacterales bacterium 68-7]